MKLGTEGILDHGKGTHDANEAGSGEEGGEEEGHEGDEDADDANDDAEADEEKERKEKSKRKKKTKASNEDKVEEEDQETLTRERMNKVRLTLLECMHAIFAQMSKNAKCPNTSGSSQSSCTRAPS